MQPLYLRYVINKIHHFESDWWHNDDKNGDNRHVTNHTYSQIGTFDESNNFKWIYFFEVVLNEES